MARWRFRHLAVLWLCPAVALADRGAVSVEGGAGWTTLNQPAPYAKPSAATLGGAASFSLGGRYGLSNDYELSLAGFFEPPVTYFHNSITIATSSGNFPGTLSEQQMRMGALLGLKRVWGSVFRFSLGLDAGWSHRAYSKLSALNDTHPNAIAAYDGLKLPDYSTDNVVVAPMAGLEWALGDYSSVSVCQRVEFLLGKESTWAVSVPVTFAWSWYL